VLGVEPELQVLGGLPALGAFALAVIAWFTGAVLTWRWTRVYFAWRTRLSAEQHVISPYRLARNREEESAQLRELMRFLRAKGEDVPGSAQREALASFAAIGVFIVCLLLAVVLP
jgi:hypothetical protein